MVGGRVGADSVNRAESAWIARALRFARAMSHDLAPTTMATMRVSCPGLQCIALATLDSLSTTLTAPNAVPHRLEFLRTSSQLVSPSSHMDNLRLQESVMEDSRSLGLSPACRSRIISKCCQTRLALNCASPTLRKALRPAL